LGNSGLTLADVYPTRGRAGKGTGKRSAVAPKYRNPENPAETWSGRGRQPLWLAHALKRRGTSIENFLIEGATKAKAPAKKARVVKKATRKKARR
jgi:DNA-binding protein H-NS